MMSSSYRPRNPGHDYYGRGVYLVTLVVGNREPLLSQFVTGQPNFVTDIGHKKLSLTPPLARLYSGHGFRCLLSKPHMATMWRYMPVCVCQTISMGL